MPSCEVSEFGSYKKSGNTNLGSASVSFLVAVMTSPDTRNLGEGAYISSQFQGSPIVSGKSQWLETASQSISKIRNRQQGVYTLSFPLYQSGAQPTFGVSLPSSINPLRKSPTGRARQFLTKTPFPHDYRFYRVGD